MTPFLAFRLWARRGPTAERLGAAVASVVALAVAAWLAVPVTDASSESLAATTYDAVGNPIVPGDPGSSTEGVPGAPGLPGSPTVSGTGSSAPVTSGNPDGFTAPTDPGSPTEPGTPTTVGGTQPAASRCANLGSPATGVTPEAIKIALTIVDLAGPVGNETFGVPRNLPDSAKAIVDGLNAGGGAACRPIVYDTYMVNPIDQNQQRTTCLDIASSDAFAVVDYAGFVSEAGQACFPEQGIPYLGLTSMTEAFVARSYPFAFSPVASTDRQLRNLALGLGERRILETPSFEKLGVFISSCFPDLNKQFRANLNRIGVSDSEISWFEGTCELVNPPSQISQAVSQHRSEGVTHVVFGASISSSQNYVRTASGISWRPQYIVGDYGSNTQGASGWGEDFDGGIAITSLRSGEQPAGIQNPTTETCQRWFEAAGMERQGESDGGLVLCDLLRLFDQAADAAGPNLTRTTLVPSLPGVGTFSSTALGDAIYAPGKYWGGDFTRRINYDIDCPCWVAAENKPRPAP